MIPLFISCFVSNSNSFIDKFLLASFSLKCHTVFLSGILSPIFKLRNCLKLEKNKQIRSNKILNKVKSIKNQLLINRWDLATALGLLLNYINSFLIRIKVDFKKYRKEAGKIKCLDMYLIIVIL